MRYSIVLLLVSCFCLRTFGQTFYITPIDADAETENGVVWTIDTEGLALNTSRFSFGLERRAILEFPIDIIPVGVIILSAAIEFEVAGLGYSDDIYPIIEFHGYAGDGVLSVDDAQRPANPIGQSDPITTVGERPFVPLDAAFVQSLIGQATHVGLYTYQVVLVRQVDFWSTEQADAFPALIIPAKLWLEVSVPVSHGGVI